VVFEQFKCSKFGDLGCDLMYVVHEVEWHMPVQIVMHELFVTVNED
jgi:hypothetical protein